MTEGRGTHKYIFGMGLFGDIKRMEASKDEIPENMIKTWDVKENEVYVTIDNSRVLSGSIATYMFEKDKDGLKLTKTHTHAMF